MDTVKKGKTGTILLGIGAVCVLLRIITKGPGWTLGAIVFLLLGALIDKAAKKRLRREVHEPLVRTAIETVFPGARYAPDSGIGYQDARNAAIGVAGGYDGVTSTDGISGTYRGVNFELSTVRLSLREWNRDPETDMERETEHEVFCGPWLLLRLGQSLPGTVRLYTRGTLEKAIRIGRKTGDAEFDKVFVTACESDEELARVLTASLRARLLKVQGCTGGCYITILPEGLVHVAQNTGRGLFDVTADDSAQLQKAYTDALLQAKRIMDALQFSGLQE